MNITTTLTLSSTAFGVSGGAVNMVTLLSRPGAPGSNLPVGGTAGQVLTKLSAADSDANWIDAAVGGGSGGISLVGIDPAAPGTGDVWVNTTDTQLKAKTATGTLVFEAFQFIAD